MHRHINVNESEKYCLIVMATVGYGKNGNGNNGYGKNGKGNNGNMQNMEEIAKLFYFIKYKIN